MKIIRGHRENIFETSSTLNAKHGVVATVGNFDGMHIGHQYIIKRVTEIASKLQIPSVVMIFEPQPEEYFKGEKFCPARLTRLREKLNVLVKFTIDYVFIMPFTKKLASLSSDKFVKKILLGCLNAKYLIVGDDFHFGSDRSGNYDYLRKFSKNFDFTVESSPTVNYLDPVTNKSDRVSSTWVREALHNGDLQLAEKLLGRRYSMCGHIVHGDKRGRTINFPTANIYLHRKRTPIEGVYVVQVMGVCDVIVYGIANIGSRPTVGGAEPLLEVHLFDFNCDIYGHYVKVEFLRKLRDEKLFPSFADLTKQIKKDVEEAKLFFQNWRKT